MDNVQIDSKILKLREFTRNSNVRDFFSTVNNYNISAKTTSIRDFRKDIPYTLSLEAVTNIFISFHIMDLGEYINKGNVSSYIKWKYTLLSIAKAALGLSNKLEPVNVVSNKKSETDICAELRALVHSKPLVKKLLYVFDTNRNTICIHDAMQMLGLAADFGSIRAVAEILNEFNIIGISHTIDFNRITFDYTPLSICNVASNLSDELVPIDQVKSSINGIARDNQFYLVWSPQGNMPKFQHLTESDAEKEAERLAKANKGKQFYVLKPIYFYEAAEVKKTML